MNVNIMKKLVIALLLASVGYFNLSAQKIMNGIVPGQQYTSGLQVNRGLCDTIFSFPTFDSIPAGLAFDGTFFYSTAQYPGLINKYLPTGQMAGTLPNPAPGSGTFGGDLDFDGTHLWMVIEQAGKIFKLDASDGHVIKSFNLPTTHLGDPNNWGCAYDNGYIWTTEYIDETLMRLDTATGSVVDSFAIHRAILPLKIIQGNLYGIQFVYGNNFQYQLVKFDKTNGAVIDSIPWCLDYPLGIAEANEHVWGLSSEELYGGSQKIYQFDSLLISIRNLRPEQSRVTVYPNPASERIFIDRSSGEPALMEMYSVLGDCVLTKQLSGRKNQVDIGLLNKGLYIICIIDVDGTIRQKLTKN